MPIRFSENLTISCRLLSKFGIFVKIGYVREERGNRKKETVKLSAHLMIETIYTDYVRERKEEEHER